MKKVSIEAVKNGFIVKVLKQGISTLKEEYEIPVYVFWNYSDMIKFLENMKLEAE